MKSIQKKTQSPLNSNPFDPAGVVLGVAEVIQIIRDVLTASMPRVVFEGELGPVSRASSGHLYFSVKDPEASSPQVLSAVMWRGPAGRLGFSPQEGAHVRIVGAPSLYPGNGRLQIVVQSMELAGDGLLRKKFEQLKAQLAAEGLFDIDRKRALPFFPKVIGVITSRTGSVIHDISVTLQERMPASEILLAHAKVQGKGAAEEIIAALRSLGARDDVGVIIVARGGGSLEDLWCFNEESVVRAIFACKKPVVTAIGHETDTTLSDLVADVRAATPTAAVRAVVPDKAELERRLLELQRRLGNSLQVVADAQQRLDEASGRLLRACQNALESHRIKILQAQLRLKKLSPVEQLQQRTSQLKLVRARLVQAAENRHLRLQGQTVESGLRLGRAYKSQLVRAHEHLSGVQKRLARNSQWALSTKNERFSQLKTRLKALDPMQVLERGYALVQSDTGACIVSAEGLSEQEIFSVKFSDGQVRARVAQAGSEHKISKTDE